MVWYTVKKMLFKTFIFCSIVPSECGKYRFRDTKLNKLKKNPHGYVLSLYHEGQWAPSRLKWQGP